MKFYHKALEISRRLLQVQVGREGAFGYPQTEVVSLISIGNVHNKLKKYELALDFYQQALAVLKTIDDEKFKKEREAIAFNNIGTVYLKQGKYQLALEFLQKGLTINELIEYKPMERLFINNIGKAYFELGQYDLAWNSYQQALVIAQATDDKEGQGYALQNIGKLLEKQNQIELAIIFYKQSVNAREAIRDNIKGLPPEFQQSYTETIAEDYRHLADLLLQQNRVLEAQRVLDLLKAQELEDYLRDVRGSDNTAQGVAERPQERQIRAGSEAIMNKAIALGKELAQLESIPVANRTKPQKQRILALRKTEQLRSCTSAKNRVSCQSLKLKPLILR